MVIQKNAVINKEVRKKETGGDVAWLAPYKKNEICLKHFFYRNGDQYFLFFLYMTMIVAPIIVI